MNNGNHTNGHFPRVVLFDIDGTLLRTTRRTDYRQLLVDMLERIFGTCGRLREVEFAGRTDFGIYYEALSPEGITFDDIRERLPEIESITIEILRQLLKDGEIFELCPGVRQLLDAISGDDRFIPSLLTGNFENIAREKLEQVGIWHYFEGRGAFGSDAIERNDLPAIAIRRFSRHLGEDLHPARFVIIGDTPRDIFCARHAGLPVIAVATGPHSQEQLASHSPDSLLGDLKQTDRVVELMARI